MLSAYALSINGGSYSLFCKKEKPAGFSFLLFHEKGRKEKLLQLHFVRQPFPFLSPSGDIFPRRGGSLSLGESPWQNRKLYRTAKASLIEGGGIAQR